MFVLKYRFTMRRETLLTVLLEAVVLVVDKLAVEFGAIAEVIEYVVEILLPLK